MTRRFNAALAVVAATIVLASTLVALPAQQAQAIDNSGFNPGNIISNAEFFNGDAMSESQIRSFLKGKVPNCNTARAYRSACLKNITMSLTSRSADDKCRAVQGGKGLDAATIIARVSRACNINPKVILVTLQKERGLVTKTAPIRDDYTVALGFGCPDTSACNTLYYGFGNQVYRAARQFQVYRMEPWFFSHQAGRTQAVRYHPNAACGSSQVYIANAATAALYNYTPYQPNASALAAGWGEGNSCASYGNRNFYQYYSVWFGTQGAGDTSPVVLANPSFESTSVGPWVQGLGGKVVLESRAETAERPAHEGNKYLVARTNNASASLNQDVARGMGIGDTYSVSAWVRSGVDGQEVKGQIAIAGIGGSNESQRVRFVAGDEWQQVTATLKMKNKGHYVLRTAFYLDTNGADLLIDDVSAMPGVPDAGGGDPGEDPGEEEPLPPSDPIKPITVPNASFEDGNTRPWKQGRGGKVNFASYKGTSESQAKEGSRYMATSTFSPSGSFNQDIRHASSLGDSYTVTAWMRSGHSTRTIRGQLAIAGIGGANESVRTKFEVGQEWTLVSATITMTRSNHSTLRLAIYLDTGHRSLLTDDVKLTPNLLSNPSFEDKTASGWFETSGAYTANIVNSSTSSLDGARHLELLRSGSAGTRVATDVDRVASAGETYTYGGWFRSTDPDAEYESYMRLIARGGSLEAEYSSTSFTVGPEWTYVEVSHTLEATHPTLRVDVQASSMPFALAVDGLVLR